MSACSIGPIASSPWPEKTRAHAEPRPEGRRRPRAGRRSPRATPAPRGSGGSPARPGRGRSSDIAEPGGHPCGVDDAARPRHGRRSPPRSGRRPARSSRRDRAICPACSVKRGLLGLVRAQLGGRQVGGLGRLGGADGLGPLGGQRRRRRHARARSSSASGSSPAAL